VETSHSIFCNFVFALGTFFQLLGRPGKMVIKCAASAFNSRKEGERVHSVVGVVGRFYSFVLSLQVTSKNEERSEFHPHQWCPVPKLPQASTSTIFSKPRYPGSASSGFPCLCAKKDQEKYKKKEVALLPRLFDCRYSHTG
jgi:hypothetical protein